MKLLLDTHIFVWWTENSKKLSPKIRVLIENSRNDIYLSIISAWEISVKTRTKKMELKTSFENTLSEPDFELLPVTIPHVLMLHKLPLLQDHRDPFDRMLIAQAQAERLTLVTLDRKFKKYSVKLLNG